MLTHSFNALQLVYPPFSNQEGEWLKHDKEVVALLKKSHLYMIAQRREAIFVWNEERIRAAISNPRGPHSIPVEIEIDGVCTTSGELNLPLFLSGKDIDAGTYDFEFGPKLFRVREGETGDVKWWYTTDLLFYWKAHRDPRLVGFDNYREFTKYNLLYVGISNKQDSFERLLAKAHHARVSILSNETQLRPEARLTDEVLLFFFESDSTFIKTYTEATELETFGIGAPYEANHVIADAEKAFLNFLDTKYNVEKFVSFPKGKDGLYEFGLTGYWHAIHEDIELITASGSFRGFFPAVGADGYSDLISVEAGKAELLKAPVV